MHTLFAPDNEAFGKLSPEQRKRLNEDGKYRESMSRATKSCQFLFSQALLTLYEFLLLLTGTLLNHITELGAYFSNGWVEGEKVPTTNWTSYLTITKPKGSSSFRFTNKCQFVYLSIMLKSNCCDFADRSMQINGKVEILVADNSTFNGVVHLIDTVLLPLTDTDA